MSRVLADFKAFGVQYMRSTTGAFFAFAFPVILILIFGAIFSSSGVQKIPLYVQDLDGTQLSQNYTRILNMTGVLTVEMIPPNVDLDGYIKEKSLTFALQIPEGFEQGILSSNMVIVTLKGDPTQSTFGVVQGATNAAAEQLSFARLGGNRLVGVQFEKIGSTEFRYIDFFVPGMIGFIALTTPLFGMAAICADYRARGFFKLLASTPLTKPEWLAAKILWFLVVMFSSIALMYVVALAVFSAHLTFTPVSILLIAAGTFLFTSMGMFLGVFVNNPESASAIANAIGFPMMFLSGTFFPLEMMPDYLQQIAKVFPLTYLNQGLRATMVLGNDSTAALNMAVVFVIGLVFFVLAARAMSWKGR